MWIGGSGGVFAPSLFIGAMLGSAYGDVAHALLPHVAHAGGAYGLVGMGAVFAAASRAPMTAVVIIFELTGDYQIILPLMFAIVVATGLSNKLTRDNIYTLKLRRRGIDLDAPTPRLMAQIRVAQAMVSPPAALHPETSLDEIVDRFTSERLDSLPVVDGAGRLLGVVAAVDLERDISANGLEPEEACSLMREAPTVHARDTLEDAVIALGATDDEGLPVLRESDDHLVGWLSHRDLLRAYRHRVGGGGDTGAPPHGGEPDGGEPDGGGPARPRPAADLGAGRPNRATRA
jgi:CIC family chloride channel protein